MREREREREREMSEQEKQGRPLPHIDPVPFDNSASPAHQVCPVLLCVCVCEGGGGGGVVLHIVRSMENVLYILTFICNMLVRTMPRL